MHKKYSLILILILITIISSVSVFGWWGLNPEIIKIACLSEGNCFIDGICRAPGSFLKEGGERVWDDEWGYYYCHPINPEQWTPTVRAQIVHGWGFTYHHCVDMDGDTQCNFTSLGKFPPNTPGHTTGDYWADPDDSDDSITYPSEPWRKIGHCPFQKTCLNNQRCGSWIVSVNPLKTEPLHCKSGTNIYSHHYCAMEGERPSCRLADYSKEHCEAGGFRWDQNEEWCDMGPFDGVCYTTTGTSISCKNDTACSSGSCVDGKKCFVEFPGKAICSGPTDSKLGCEEFGGEWDNGKCYFELKIDITTEGGKTNPEEGIYLYEYNKPVSINATPDAGWAFTGWTGDCSGIGECELIIDSDKTIEAQFSAESPPPEEDPEEDPEDDNGILGELGECQLQELFWTNQTLILNNWKKNEELFLFIISTLNSNCSDIIANFSIYTIDNETKWFNIGDSDNEEMIEIYDNETETRLWYGFTNWEFDSSGEFYFKVNLTRENESLQLKSNSIFIVDNESDYQEENNTENLDSFKVQCTSLWDCKEATWGECKAGVQTRDISQCEFVGKSEQKTLCALPVAAKSCITKEEEFPIFNWINALIVCLMLIGYYFINHRKNFDM